MTESFHSSAGNEPLLPTHHSPAQLLSAALTTAEAAALDAAVEHPLPSTPPSELFQNVRSIYAPYTAPTSPIGGPYPAMDPPLQQRGSPGENTQRVASSSRHGTRRATSGINQLENQPEADIADRGVIPEERIANLSGLSRRVTTVPAKPASEEDEKQAMEWIVPQVGNGTFSRGMSMYDKPPRTVAERLEETEKAAEIELKKYQTQAERAAILINVAMGAQIVSNALITGLSAATSNRHAQIGVSALGALGTIISSFLVRVRGTREPERSKSHAQNLEKYLRDLKAFMADEGGSRDRKFDPDVRRFRNEFERLQSAIHQAENGQPVGESNSAPIEVTKKV